MNASWLVETAIDRLRENYWRVPFYVERDIVWTVQRELQALCIEHAPELRVHNDFPILPGNRRALCVDLALVDENHTIHAAIEFKYEPSHLRGGVDIWPTKFPVVFWSSVLADITRAERFVADGRSPIGYAILIDEGGHFSRRDPIAGGTWRAWETDDGRPPVLVHYYSTTNSDDQTELVHL